MTPMEMAERRRFGNAAELMQRRIDVLKNQQKP